MTIKVYVRSVMNPSPDEHGSGMHLSGYEHLAMEVLDGPWERVEPDDGQRRQGGDICIEAPDGKRFALRFRHVDDSPNEAGRAAIPETTEERLRRGSNDD